MGVIKSAFVGAGKGALGLGKGIAKGAGALAGGVGKSAGYGGGRVINSFANNTLASMAFVGGAAATGYALADLDGRNDRGAVAGKAAVGAAAATAIPGMAIAGAMGTTGLATGAGMVGAATLGLGKSMIKMPTEALSLSNMGEIKFSKLGGGLLFGDAIVGGLKDATQKWEGIRMGTNDGMMRKATPTIPQNTNSSYSNNGGATGDLVFSMYNNR